MSQTLLFPDADGEDEPVERPNPDLGLLPPPRLRRPNREQMVLRPCSLEQLLPEDHDARTVWAVVLTWDLTRFLDTLRARGAAPGRAATDPRLLIALWLYAATQGVASARELDRLCRESDPYRWLCGGVPVNYHSLSDFRVAHEAALDDLLTQMLTVLIHGRVVSVHRIAQDGTRVRAGAGANSFKKRETLERAAQQARDHLAIIKRQAERLGETAARQRAARQRAAREKQQRLDQALKELAEVERAKAEQKDKPTKKNPPRASTTDPQARYMRMPDGGTRPAYNVQLAVDTTSRAIVGVELTNAGSDAGQSEPMREQVEDRSEAQVKDHLMDGGYVKLEEIDRAAVGDVTVYMPVPKPRTVRADPHQPKRTDSAAVAAWRQRMGTAAAKATYKQRAATIETVNGELKTERGLDRFRVRGRTKARCVALWSVLAYNVVHLGAQLLGLVA
jgi:transposase